MTQTTASSASTTSASPSGMNGEWWCEIGVAPDEGSPTSLNSVVAVDWSVVPVVFGSEAVVGVVAVDRPPSWFGATAVYDWAPGMPRPGVGSKGTQPAPGK